MPTQIFVNLPVKDLQKSVNFFSALGYRFDPRFTDENATGMIVADGIYVMLLVRRFFEGFTSKPVVDATKATEVLICLSCESREHVEQLVRKAKAAGGQTPMEPRDYGFMYQHGFEDLDGHMWELAYMKPGAFDTQGPQ